MSAAWPAEVRGIRLWVKLAAFGAVAIVATHAVHLAVGSRVASGALAREQASLGSAVARLVASQAADAILTNDAVTLNELMARTAADEGIAYCFVVRDGRVLASSLPNGGAQRLLGLRGAGRTGPVVAVDGDRRTLDIEAPIMGGRAGAVRLGIDMSILQSTRRAIGQPLTRVALAMIALSAAIAVVTARRATRPIEEIIGAADRFDPAVQGRPIHPRGGREIAALARRFNGMTARLRAAHEEQERVRVRALANERLATLGSLVAGVAHEVNNPIASLKGAVAMLREDVNDPAARTADLDLMERALDQLAGVVQRLLDFGRARPLDVAPVSVAALARDSAGLAAMSLKRRGIVIEELAEPGFDDAPVLADRKEIGQALLNLLLNAAFVSKDYGRLRLRLRRRGPLRGIAVEDDGPGIPAGIRDRIFDPFFSTKPAGQGTGLGLTVARAVADRHHGALEFDFPGSGGTVATLWLPTASAPPPRVGEGGPVVATPAPAARAPAPPTPGA
ncbi:MAG TPA: ATP-binding protein [Anaeromyxobacteraceae bacterium]|nr:ATP-binding protein [Anaeromyxobacteraceae bacterium]